MTAQSVLDRPPVQLHTCLESLQEKDKQALYHELYFYHTRRLISQCSDGTDPIVQDSARDHVCTYLQQMLEKEAPHPLSTSELKQWIVAGFYRYGKFRILDAVSKHRRFSGTSLSLGDEDDEPQQLPEELVFRPQYDMGEDYRLLEDLGVHPDWIFVYKCEVHRCEWAETAQLLHYCRGVSVKPVTLRKYWGRLRKAVAGAVAAYLLEQETPVTPLPQRHFSRSPIVVTRARTSAVTSVRHGRSKAKAGSESAIQLLPGIYFRVALYYNEWMCPKAQPVLDINIQYRFFYSGRLSTPDFVPFTAGS